MFETNQVGAEPMSDIEPDVVVKRRKLKFEFL